ncbi:mechanosensitive ion channel family protein [Puniceibacterium sp. IMCC21224]|uniref:mechanosensitive ion channel family protein n=1 Tax=Puniceibacterium sp. IMCC21224 TaxID=1618204 RepID=UPI001E3E550D|nr:mechanosensitive ion channel family protein [Puniceibacterium sp. IMCC21224]
MSQTEDQPSGPITIEDNANRDGAIAVRIREILAQLDGFEDVTVTVNSGIVTLRGTTLDSTTSARLNALAGRVEGVVAIENEVSETTDVVRRLNPAMQRFMTRMRQAVAFVPLAGVALTVFSLVLLFGLLIARLRNPWDRLAPNAFISDIYRQLIRLAFFVAGVVIALDILGATALLSTILGAAGIIGLAIGFAVRDTVENFIASIMLSIRQPFRPNDTVEIEGDTGKVIRLTSRATILLSFDGNHIRIPNATVFKSRIVNYSYNDERRFVFDFGLDYATDLVLAQTVAQTTLEGLPFVLSKPKANVWIEDMADSWIVLRCTAWIRQHDTSIVAARGEAMRLVMAALSAEGVVMPEPTFRILGGAADIPTTETRARAPDLSPAQDVDAVMEQELEDIVDDERELSKDKDLLTRQAPTE